MSSNSTVGSPPSSDNVTINHNLGSKPVIQADPFGNISFANSTSLSTLPTEGSSLSALHYNLNERFQWPKILSSTGVPTYEDIYLYSDLAFNSGGNFYYDFKADPSTALFHPNDTSYPNQTLMKTVTACMTYGDWVIQVNTYSPEEYSTKFASSDGLLGMSWLPWNVTGLPDKNGNYCVKCYYSAPDVAVKCNPMRREVLYIKMFTILKIFGIGIGSYALIKLIYHLSKK